MSAKPVRTSGKLNAANDTYPGGGNASPGLAPGQPGQILDLPTDDMALVESDTSVGTLYAGKYMYVRTKSTSSASPARGLVAFVDTLSSFQVTPDNGGVAAGEAEIAGIYVSAPTKGNYCWIQVSGKASVQCKTSSVTSNVKNDTAVVTTTTNTVDGVADGTTMTSLKLKDKIGYFLEAPAADGIKLVMLQGLPFGSRR
jgi:hypothetical protein